MNGRTLARKLSSVEDYEIKRFCRYTYESISYLKKKSGVEVGYNGFYSYVKMRFEDRKDKLKKPYFEDYSNLQKTKMIIESLVILEQLKMKRI
ncbi:MAG: hypothetical protein WC867_04040 [Candidatus Pacearchaeota archaeon]|jgi:hypothetical protein